VHVGLGLGELRRGRGLARTGGRETGFEFRKRCRELGRLRRVAFAMDAGLTQPLRDLLQFLPPAAAQLASVLDRLLGARNRGTDLVIATLHLGDRGRVPIVFLAGALDGRLDRPLCGQCRLQTRLALVEERLLRARLALDLAQPERQQFRVQPPLLVLERLVTTCGRRLALQVAQLLLELVAQIREAREVVSRVGDAGLGLAAAFLVARDARGLLEERAHVLGPGLDDPRDHVLLDDRVAARAQARAEEHLRDVLAPAPRAVEEIRGSAVAGHDALERHLGVARILAAEGTVRIVEHEFDRGLTHGLAGA
jgi:hypothetical protein